MPMREGSAGVVGQATLPCTTASNLIEVTSVNSEGKATVDVLSKIGRTIQRNLVEKVEEVLSDSQFRCTMMRRQKVLL